jgi:hypothetical protein
MHYLPVLLSLLIVKFSVVLAFGPRRLWEFAKDFVTIGEDHWSWTTCSGDLFEDAELELIEDGELVLRHRYGVVRLAIAELTAHSRRLLASTQMWANYAASVAPEAEVTPFVLESYAVKAA